jgi:hypothetical protein
MEFRQFCKRRMSNGMAQNYALMTKVLVGCDKITVCIEKTLLKRLKCSLRSKWDRMVLRNALKVCAPLEECGLMLKAGTYIRVEVSTES